MCSARLQYANGIHGRKFIECSTNADRLWYDAMAEAHAAGARLVAVEPCFYALESAVRAAEIDDALGQTEIEEGKS